MDHAAETHVIGGVDTHKDLHVAAVVDHRGFSARRGSRQPDTGIA